MQVEIFLQNISLFKYSQHKNDSKQIPIFSSIPYIILKKCWLADPQAFLVFHVLIETDIHLTNFQFWENEKVCWALSMQKPSW